LSSSLFEHYAERTFENLANPGNGEQWLAEILALPVATNYGQWMNQHSDGRFSLGYRTGKFAVNQAISTSGIGILDLSTYHPTEILDMSKN